MVDVVQTGLPGVLLLKPQVFGDERGFFSEIWRRSAYEEAGLRAEFVQTNVSRSAHGVVRGLHYQWPRPQGKLLWVLEGTIFDVAADIRVGSSHYGQWTGHELSAENHHQLWVPEGFAHGFQVLSDTALVCYQCTQEFAPELDRAVAWDDPDIGVEWPLPASAVSERDASAPALKEIDPQRLPEMQQ